MKTLKFLVSAAAAIFVMTACDNSGDGKQKGGDISGSQVDLTGLLVDGQFPIIAWTGINSDETASKFGPMKECGINVYLGWYDRLDEVMTALDNAEKAGVKLIIKSNELSSDTKNTVQAMMSHSSLFGYHIEDEPETNEFSTLASLVNSIRQTDTGHFCYINLYPNWAWGSIDGYMSKVLSFLNEVPGMRFLSFDQYPIMEVNGVSSIRNQWYKNLEDIRKVARARNLPFWAFALALSHKTDEAYYPIPTLAELRLQMFSNLVYGAHGFQYFTYWGIYQSSPTQVYDRVKTVNAELQGLSKIFIGADIADVWHIGSDIPYGTHSLKSSPTGINSISTGSDAGLVMSQVKKDGELYYAIVNKNYKSSVSFDVEFNGNAWQLDKECYRSVAKSGTFSINAGDIVLFQIQ